jgi:NitT/TauT family transport system permease protein
MTAARPFVRRATLPAVAVAAVVTAIVAAWWTTALALPPYLLPSPAAVATVLASHPGLFARNAAVTLERAVVGGSVGVAAGFALAVAVTAVPWLQHAVYPYLVALRVLPTLAVAPVLVVYLGTGFTTAVVLVALVAAFPTAVSAAAGFAALPDRYRDLLASVDAHPLRGFFAVRLPWALPDVLAGVKQSAAVAVVGAVVAEWVVADDGLGFLVLVAAENVRTALLVAALLVLFAVGGGLYAAVAAVQRAVAPFGR